MPNLLAWIPPGRWRLVLNVLGLAFLLAGYTAAVLIWRAQDNALASDPVLESPLDSRKDSRQIEEMYGKSGLIAEGWAEGLRKLTHGRPLARMLIVVSSVAAIGCFLAGGRRR